jgi:phosphocarrier protein
MTERRVKILNETGVHARPAALFVETANRFRSTVRVVAGDREADGRSILSLLLIELTPGSEILIRADGQDEERAADALAALIESAFRE